jgi:hypothetical protein
MAETQKPDLAVNAMNEIQTGIRVFRMNCPQ